MDSFIDFDTSLISKISTAKSIRDQHGKGASYLKALPPDAVLFADCEEDVISAVKSCYRSGTPLIPFGSGTSLEGHVAAPLGGLSINLSNLNRILSVDVDDFTCRVQPGVTREQLNRHLKGTGLFFPVDPGAGATFGGMVATAASGTNAVRYGTMRENLMGLRIVLSDGSVINTGNKSVKSSAGYNLTQLFCGSEGTLGVITEIQVKLSAMPERLLAGKAVFSSIEKAVESVVELKKMCLSISRIELLDELQLKAINKYLQTDYLESPTLFFELSGSAVSLEAEVGELKSCFKFHGCRNFQFSFDSKEREALWKARYAAHDASSAFYPKAEPWSTDVCVPISKLPHIISITQKKIKASGIFGAIVGHVGDGNFHVIFSIRDANDLKVAKKINGEMIDLAIKADGTCSGEHGIGMGKRDFLAEQVGSSIDVMKRIKQTLDPKSIMNPQKIFI